MRIIKMAISAILVLTTLISFSSCKKKEEKDVYAVTNRVEITVKDYGTIKAELYGNAAPITVTNFIKLVNEGFYDGLTIHRISKNFVIQGGDPSGDGTGGSGETIKGEFSANGVDNPIKHKKGTLSMARRSSPMDSATSQFFICLNDSTASQLDNNYAAFGMVYEGLDVVDKIAAAAVSGETPISKIVMTSIKEISDSENEKADDAKETKQTTASTLTAELANQSAENIENTGDEYTVTNKVEITVEGYGTIKAELYGNEAPITVANFIKLVNEGFYDGLTIHRISKNFVIQGGDPNGNGTGGSGEAIKGEFSANGVNNPIKHKKGTLSMARRSYPMDSATSQFFICLNDSTASQLDGSYAAFGMVYEGLDVVDKIAAAAVSGETPTSKVVMTSIKEII